MDLCGVQLGKYHVVEQLGEGGMAEVYKAYQPELDRYVAIKVIASELGRDPAFLETFEREAKTLARLEHPNILPIYDSGRYQDTPYVVMQYVQGGSLAERLGRPLPAEEAGRIICQVGDALSYAHALGIIHRDVKPSNVLFDRSGRALLADFGIAQDARRAHETGGREAGAGGTPAYMAPEQRGGQAVDGRADIYALGVMFYELLSARRAGEQSPLTRSLDFARLPLPLREVIACATATHRSGRYEMVEDMVTAVQEALLKLSGEYARPPTSTQQALEIVAVATFTLAGLWLGMSTLLDIFAHRGGWLVWAPPLVGATGFLLCSALFILRDRSKAISGHLVGAVAFVMLAALGISYPLGLVLEAGAEPGMYSIGLVFLLPGVLSLFIAAGLYAYDHRWPQAVVQRNLKRTRQLIGQKSPAAAARRSRFDTRRARDILIKYLATGLVVIAGTRALAHWAPADSAFPALAWMIQYALIVSGVFLAAGLAAWYTFSLITSASEAPAGSTPPQLASNVEARQAWLDKACDYQARIKAAIAQLDPGPLQERIQLATRQLDEWVDYIHGLVARLDELERDPVIRRDLSTVPRAVHVLEARLSLDQDTDTGVQEAVHQALAARRTQLRHLRALERVVAQAELHGEETVAALGTLYSQVLLVDVKGEQEERARRLHAAIDEQVQALRDLLDAMDEVKKFGRP
ncbi:MAG: protein kinase [Thermoflexales bacterium]|nr:protein kinase [Thermoflexales bacterium]